MYLSVCTTYYLAWNERDAQVGWIGGEGEGEGGGGGGYAARGPAYWVASIIEKVHFNVPTTFVTSFITLSVSMDSFQGYLPR